MTIILDGRPVKITAWFQTEVSAGHFRVTRVLVAQGVGTWSIIGCFTVRANDI